MSTLLSRIHAFRDDLLGDETVDAVELGRRVAQGEVTPHELAAAALGRATAVTELAAVAATLASPRVADTRRGAVPSLVAGVPTYLKDNVDVAGLPTGHGSEAFTPKVRTKDDPYVTQLLGTGLTLLGKTRLPEFGFNASTEFRTGDPARNPWNPAYSVGASSGGAAALVAAGVVPIAHANDGGGSIRIPAAAAGLVGLKPTRGRHVDAAMARTLPINIVSDGVVTRTVRDQAAFHGAMERVWTNPALPPVGQVDGPSGTPRRIGLLVETINGAPIDPEVLAAVRRTATALEGAGHRVELIGIPVDPSFEDDFTLYWGLLAVLSTTVGAPQFGLPFHQGRLDGLTRGLRRYAVRRLHRLPGAMRRLGAVPAQYDAAMADYDAVLSPTVGHPAPELGWLSPNRPFDQLLHRLTQYVVTTPLHNVAGAPGLAMPVAVSEAGLPISVHLSGRRGEEATLLDLGYQIEALLPRPRISQPRTSEISEIS